MEITPSASTKSESALERPVPKKWRVSRTLKRRTDFRPIEPDDLRYFWAAYKQGAFGLAEGMEPEKFQELVGGWIADKCQMAWTLLADVNAKMLPIGAVFCAWSPFGTFLIVLYVVWMPWASKRTILESTINFVAKVRKEHNFHGYAAPEHKRLYEVCAMHGLCRRVGTTYTAIPGKALAIFETRSGEK